MVQNLPESFFYEKLPDAVISQDERGLIEALMGGIQDRFDDLRAQARKVNDTIDPTSSNEGNNVVLVDLQSDAGVRYTRSVDILPDTPADGTTALTTWVAGQLKLDEDKLSNVRYGRDLLRTVETSTLGLLADTIGAVLHRTAITTDADASDLVKHYFPRLRIKGTGRSFEALGRQLGFDDVIFTPLWGRVSPRQPDDPGASSNDPDYAYAPEFWPRQDYSMAYDPGVMRDGAFYIWTGTAHHGTSSTAYYDQTVTGRNPFIDVVILGVQYGTVVHPSSGTFVLAGGGPHVKATVTPDGATVRFDAIAEGDSWNGLTINVTGEGTSRVLSITDRLSSVKYRTSYFDLRVVSNLDTAGDLFGDRVVQPNKNLVGTPSLTSDGVAASPYRPWIAGSIAAGSIVGDWLSQVDSTTTRTIAQRYQATGTNRELQFDVLSDAAAQAVQAFEEVRPATRYPRVSRPGLAIIEDFRYACYLSSGSLYVAPPGTFTRTGSHVRTPDPTYYANIVLQTGTLQSELSVETIPSAGTVAVYSLVTSGSSVSGTYNFQTGSYTFTSVLSASGTFFAGWTALSTEVIRSEPTVTDKTYGTVSYQLRPEDDDDSVLHEFVDDFPWLRGLTLGGESIDASFYRPENDNVVVRSVAPKTVVFDQSGAGYALMARVSPTGVHRPVLEVSATDGDYTPGAKAIGFSGTFRNLASYTGTQSSTINSFTDSEVIFGSSGYGLFHVGLVHGVLVADPVKFNAPAVRDNWVSWLPLDEHAEDSLSVREAHGQSVQVSGLNPENRKWDPSRGWVLSPSSTLSVTLPVNDTTTASTLGFWFKGTPSGSGVTTILEAGPVSFDYNASNGALQAYAKHAAGSRLPVGVRVAAGWTYAALSVTDTSASFLSGTDTTNFIGNQVNDDFDTTPGDISLTGASGPYQIHDLRYWNAAKASGHLLAVITTPGTVLVDYPVSRIDSVDREDQYGLRVLPNGRIHLTDLPPWTRSYEEQRVTRYLSSGSYVGAPNRQVQGLGGGNTLPSMLSVSAYPLGFAFPLQTSAGTFVVAGSNTTPPYENSLWYSDNASGTYVKLSGGYTGSGSIASTGSLGTSPWPYPFAQINSAREVVTVIGDNNRTYDVFLVGDAVSTGLQAKLRSMPRSLDEIRVNPMYRTLLDTGTYVSGTVSGTLPLSGGSPAGPAVVRIAGTTSVIYIGSLYQSEQLAPAETRLLTSNLRMSVSASGSELGYVYQKASSGTVTTPSLWMYLNQRAYVDVTNAWTTWVYGGVSYDADRYGNTLSPQVAALNENGVLEFQNSRALPAGRYRLHILSSNVGKPDANFDGFKVEIEVNNTVIEGRLLADRQGYSVSGWDKFEFDLDSSTGSEWILTVRWLNAFSNPLRGVGRILAIHGYRLEKVGTELWKVDINTAGGSSLKLSSFVQTAGTYNPSAAGGWLETITGDGVTRGCTHESLVTVRSNESGQLALSGQLTSRTNDHFSTVVVGSLTGNATLSNPASMVYPTFGTLSAVLAPTDIAPTWFWSGAITLNPGFTVTAKMPVDCRVRLAVSEDTSFSSPVYSDYAYAIAAVNSGVAKMTVSGLKPWTTYFYAVEANGVLSTTNVGSVTTFGSDQRSFRFAVAGEVGNTLTFFGTQAIWSAMESHDPTFLLLNGNWHNTSITTNSASSFRSTINTIMSSGTAQANFWKNTPVVWALGPRDFGGQFVDATSVAVPAMQTAYRQCVPHYPLPSGGPEKPVYYSFRVGRCVFVVTDNRSERSPCTQTDNSSKVMWSTQQEEWFKQQVLAASKDADVKAIFWVNPTPWMGAALVNSDTWSGYVTFRNKLTAWLFNNAITKLFVLGGGMPCAAIDDGSNSSGNLPVFHAAPIDFAGTSFGTPFTLGPVPTSSTATARQYGVVSVYDYGTAALVAFAAYGTNTTPLTYSGSSMVRSFLVT